MAPTGSIVKLPGAGEGIHPVCAQYFPRRVRFSTTNPTQAKTVQAWWTRPPGGEVQLRPVRQHDGRGVPTKEKLVAEVEALGYDLAIVESADEIDLYAMLAVQAMHQSEHADNAVSFTVNFPKGKYDLDEAAGIIGKWLPDLKGTTLMPDGTREQAPYERLIAEQFAEYEATSVEDSTDEDCATGACPVQ
ncbi:hypothetical protein [Streptomyces sp. NPDC000931]|uniref:hypothetical protein n=1 Tax=Streptomyces sp. NPDC000931 TaxID=3154372 RepID=UPI00331DF91F